MQENNKCALLLCLLVLALLRSGAWATHGSFHDHYTDYLGIRCCSTAHDCMPMPVSLISRDGDTTVVLVAGVQVELPAGSVHLSENSDTYVCLRNRQMPATALNIRCAFFTFSS